MSRTILLRGDHVSLALPIREDFQDLSLWNDPEYRCYGSKPNAVITEDPEERIKKILKNWHREHYFSIIRNGDETFLGFLSFSSLISAQELHIGLLRERGKGYGTEAVRLGLTWTFAIKNVPTVVLFVTTDNKRAIRAYKKAGFKEVAVIPNMLCIGYTYKDMLLMLAQQDTWLKENRAFVEDCLKRSGYPLDALPPLHIIR